MELNLLPSSSSPDLTWSGVTATRLGLLEPGGGADLSLELAAELSGLHSVSGVRLTDTLLKRTYDFDDLCQVFACHSKDMVEELT